jgi:hypothetical protein
LLTLKSIIFIHGLGANPDSTWGGKRPQLNHRDDGNVNNHKETNEMKPVNWVRDFFWKDLPQEWQDNTRLFFFNHDTWWEKDALYDGLDEVATKFLEGIHKKFKTTDNVSMLNPTNYNLLKTSFRRKIDLWCLLHIVMAD